MIWRRKALFSQPRITVHPVPESSLLELVELWSFVLKKANQAWIWIALCRKTRQVVSYALGDRSEKTCWKLWEALPEMYRTGHCFTYWLHQLLGGSLLGLAQAATENRQQVKLDIWVAAEDPAQDPAEFP